MHTASHRSGVIDRAFPVSLSLANDKTQHGELLPFSTQSGTAFPESGDGVSALKGNWPYHPSGQPCLLFPQGWGSGVNGAMGASLKACFMPSPYPQTKWPRALPPPR